MLAKGLSARFISFTVMFSLWLMGCGTAIHQPVIDRPPGPLYRYPLYTYQSPTDQRGLWERALSEVGERCFIGRTELAYQSVPTSSPFPLARPEIAGGGSTASPFGVSPTMASSFLPRREGLSFANEQVPQARPQNPQKLQVVRDLTLLNQLADIEAVRFVKQPHPELILVGPAAEKGQGLQYDDWLTILRSIGQYGPPGVSIDPGPSPNEMVVRYFGGIEQTHLGSVFFEADRTLKLLSTGYDNLNCSKVSLLPASSASELEMLEQEFLKDRVAGPAGWHRFWFDLAPDEVEVSPDNLSARIPSRRLFVDEQAIGPARASLGSGKQFADQISKQFLELGVAG